MNSDFYFQKIMELPGLDNMKEVIRQWDRVSKNLPQTPNNVPLVLPDILLKTRPGAGKTHFFQLLSEYLDRARLLDFYGDVKFFEFYLEYCPPGGHLSELGRLIGDMKDAAGFRSEYRGLLALDVSPWKNSFEENHFIRILEYLSSIDEKVCIIFVVENFSNEEAMKAEQILSSFCRIRCVDFNYPSPKELTDYCIRHLEQYQMLLVSGACKLLEESIEELMKSAYFDGYKTVNRLCQDIAFELGSIPGIKNGPVTAEHLFAFHKDSVFVKKLSALSRMRNIGFGGGKS